MTDAQLVVAAVGLVVWTIVLWRAWRNQWLVQVGRRRPQHGEATVLALVIVLWGTAAGSVLDNLFTVEAPGLLAFAVAGVMLLLAMTVRPREMGQAEARDAQRRGLGMPVADPHQGHED